MLLPFNLGLFEKSPIKINIYTSEILFEQVQVVNETKEVKGKTNKFHFICLPN